MPYPTTSVLFDRLFKGSVTGVGLVEIKLSVCGEVIIVESK